MNAGRSPVDIPAGIVDWSGNPAWGSDLIMDVLRTLEIEYAAVLPGSTFRGIHDSAVNYAANHMPELILCNHEMITVAMATGYARVTGRPMAAIVHNLVGLLNTSMTIYDAWVDRVPVLVMGGTGPMDAARRRPGIDWTHTALIQGNAVRDFTKFDDQPASLAAIPESLIRAHRMAVTEPAGPVYVCFDVALQEAEMKAPVPIPDISRYQPSAHPEPNRRVLRQAAEWLVDARLPLLLADRMGRHVESVAVLVELAELLAAPVVDLGGRPNFPSPHALDFAGASTELAQEADIVLALDVNDLAGSLRKPVNENTRVAEDASAPGQRVISISLDELLHRAWSTEYQALPAIDLPMLADSALALPLLLEECRHLVDDSARSRIEARREALKPLQERLRAKQRRFVEEHWDSPQLSEQRLAVEVWNAIKNEDYYISKGRLRTLAPGFFDLRDPSCYIGGGGGGAVGAGPGIALGAALALRGTGKVPVAFLGDGDFISGIQSMWTAVHYRIPSLWVIRNNRTYYNDEAHQERIAVFRDRPPENRWVAMRLEQPEIDLAAVARGFGATAEGPIRTAEELREALPRAVAAVKRGEFVVLDARTENRPVERTWR